MFQAIYSSEHWLSHGVFLLIQMMSFVNFLKTTLTKSMYRRLSVVFIYGVMLLFVSIFLYYTYKGKVNFGSRVLSLFDPSYAKKFIPLVESVSEHEPTSWPEFFSDLHYMLVFAPLGLYFCYKKPTNPRLFVAIFAVCSVYFSSAMIRLLLISSPALCILSGIGVSDLLNFVAKQHKRFNEEYDKNGYLVTEVTTESLNNDNKKRVSSIDNPMKNLKVLIRF